MAAWVHGNTGQLGETLSGLVGRHRSVVGLTADRPLKHGRVTAGWRQAANRGCVSWSLSFGGRMQDRAPARERRSHSSRPMRPRRASPNGTSERSTTRPPRRLRPEVSKNSSAALSSNKGESARSIATCAPAMASSSPSSVRVRHRFRSSWTGPGSPGSCRCAVGRRLVESSGEEQVAFTLFFPASPGAAGFSPGCAPAPAPL